MPEKISFPFLPIHQQVGSHPKILRFKRIHGPGSWGSILILWLWASMNRPDGDLTGMEDEEIEAVSEWRGTPGAMVDTMLKCALFDGERGFLKIHNWTDWQQHFVRAWQRAQSARRMRNLRRRRSVTRDAQLRDRDANVTPRGEKRRGEEKRKDPPYSPPRGTGVSDPFDAFWLAYPRKAGKAAARKAYDRATRGHPDLHPRILAALAEHSASEQWTRDGGKFIPHPATWLNQGRWDDELTPAADDAGFLDVFPELGEDEQPFEATSP